MDGRCQRQMAGEPQSGNPGRHRARRCRHRSRSGTRGPRGLARVQGMEPHTGARTLEYPASRRSALSRACRGHQPRDDRRTGQAARRIAARSRAGCADHRLVRRGRSANLWPHRSQQAPRYSAARHPGACRSRGIVRAVEFSADPGGPQNLCGAGRWLHCHHQAARRSTGQHV